MIRPMIDHGIVLHIKMVLVYNFFVLYLAPILCGLEIKASNIFIFYCSMFLVKLFLVAGHIHTQLAINSKNISISIHSAPLKNFIKCWFKGTIISKYLRSKTIFINAKILILYDKISIFAFMKILLSEDTERWLDTRTLPLELTSTYFQISAHCGIKKLNMNF